MRSLFKLRRGEMGQTKHKAMSAVEHELWMRNRNNRLLVKFGKTEGFVPGELCNICKKMYIKHKSGKCPKVISTRDEEVGR
jgi:hypothetical protein